MPYLRELHSHKKSLWSQQALCGGEGALLSHSVWLSARVQDLLRQQEQKVSTGFTNNTERSYDLISQLQNVTIMDMEQIIDVFMTLN